MSRPVPHPPTISIIIPEDLQDSRSNPEFLREWAAQTCDPADYEIILVMQRGSRERQEQVRQYLRATDSLLVRDLPNETAAYDIGAQAARGRWLLITENHVMPERNCLQKTLDWLKNHPDNPFMLGSSQLAPTRTARVEGENFDRLLAAHWSQPGNWHRVHIRGFVIRKEDYFRAGGLPTRYGTYSQTVLAESLHRLGIEVEYLEEKVIRHLNCATFDDLRADTVDTTQGSCRFLDESRRNQEQNAAVPVPSELRLRHAVLLFRSAMENSESHKSRRTGRSRGRLMRLCLANWCSALMRGRAGRFFSELAYISAKARFYCTRPGSESEYSAFLRIWRQMIQGAEIRWKASRRDEDTIQEAVPFLSLPTHQLAGFYGLETYDDRQFRWSEPVCEIHARLTATDHRITLDTGSLRGGACQFRFHLFLNDRQIPGKQIHIENGKVSFLVPEDWIDEKCTRLTIVSDPLSETDGDRLFPRQLGMPVFEVQFEAVQKAQLPQPAGRAA